MAPLLTDRVGTTVAKGEGVKFVIVPPGEAPTAAPTIPASCSAKRASRIFIGAIAGVVLALGVFGAVVWQSLDLTRGSAQPNSA